MHLVLHADTLEDEPPEVPQQKPKEEQVPEVKEDLGGEGHELKEFTTTENEAKEEDVPIIVSQPEEVAEQSIIDQKKIAPKKIDLNDPYCNHVDEDSNQLIYDQLKDGSIPEADLSFEFEPAFEPKNIEDYVVNPDKPVILLKEFPTYYKELSFEVKGKLDCLKFR